MKDFRLFIGNVPPNTNDQELSSEFSAYGNVKNVEIKTKDDNIFGFINLETEDLLISQCIREFSEQKFKGVYLKVARAKESFLDKLKREREEAEKRSHKSNVEGTNYESKKDHEAKKTVPALPSFKASAPVESSSSSESESDQEPEPAPKPVPRVVHKPLPRNEDEFVKKWNCEGYVENGLLRIVPITGEITEVIDVYKKNKNEKPVLNDADQKRLKGLQSIKSSYESQKKLIQSSLSASVDGAANKKIKFELNSEEADDSKKLTLFDDDEDDEDLSGYKKDFQVKKQFQGAKGEELFHLQAKYKHDSRFVMDSKFMDKDVKPGDKKKKLQEKKKKPTAVEKEVEIQLKLLQEMDASNKDVNNRSNNQKNQKPMVRFDPTKQEHNKYVTNNQSLEEEILENENQKIHEEYQVSDEQYTKVSKNLKEALQSQSGGFSLLQMFGKASENDLKPAQQENYATVESKFSGKRFRHDSSDESDAEGQSDPKKIKSSTIPMTSTGTKSGKYTKMGVFQENFFYSLTDDRLKEGLKFFIQGADAKNREEESVSSLKKIVKLKTKRQTHMQSSKEMYAKSFRKPFAKKVMKGGGHRNKFKK